MDGYMKSSSEIKKTAMDSLSGNWGGAIGCSAAAMGISYAVSFVLGLIANIAIMLSGLRTAFIATSRYGGAYLDSMDLEAAAGLLGVGGIVVLVTALCIYILCALISSVVLSNITIGQYKFYLNLVSGKRASVGDIFFTLRYGFFKTFCLYLVMELKAALWMLSLYLPGTILTVTGAGLAGGGSVVSGALIMALGIIAMIASLIPYFMAVMRYSMAPLAYLEDMSLGVFGAIKRSKELMKGHKGDLFVLYLSFIGWYFLMFFTCGIGFLFLTPYILCSVAVFYNELLGRPTTRFGVPFNGGYYGNNGGGASIDN